MGMATKRPSAEPALSAAERRNATMRVRAWLSEHGNGARLAAALGIPRPSASQIKNGRRRLNDREIRLAWSLMELKGLNVLIAPLTEREYTALPFTTGERPAGGGPAMDKDAARAELTGLYDSLTSSGADAQAAFMRAAHEAHARLRSTGGPAKQAS
jgi:hypothetical protein